jgi:hypothetical protein
MISARSSEVYQIHNAAHGRDFGTAGEDPDHSYSECRLMEVDFIRSSGSCHSTVILLIAGRCCSKPSSLQWTRYQPLHDQPKTCDPGYWTRTRMLAKARSVLTTQVRTEQFVMRSTSKLWPGQPSHAALGFPSSVLWMQENGYGELSSRSPPSFLLTSSSSQSIRIGLSGFS